MLSPSILFPWHVFVLYGTPLSVIVSVLSTHILTFAQKHGIGGGAKSVELMAIGGSPALPHE